MCRKSIPLFSAILVLSLMSSSAFAGVVYGEPAGGWTYVYTGADVAAGGTTALDGTWDHTEGSDAWDGSAAGAASDLRLSC